MVKQETRFPEEEGTTIRVGVRSPEEFSLFIRIPSWASRTISLAVNGVAEKNLPIRSGYAELRRNWKDGDKVEIKLPMSLSVECFPDDSTVGAILYGPIVLAGELGTQGMTKEMQAGLALPDVDRMVSQGAAQIAPSIVADLRTPSEWIKPVPGAPLTFRTTGAGQPRDLTLVPFYRMFGQRYAVYWNIDTPEQWRQRKASHAGLPADVLDRVTVADRGSDREHNFQAWRFENGETAGTKWVKSPLWFRYDVNVVPDSANVLRCSYLGGDTESVFDILVDGLKMTEEKIDGSHAANLVAKEYAIPPGLVRGKSRVAIQFRARQGKQTAKLSELVILRPAS